MSENQAINQWLNPKNLNMAIKCVKTQYAYDFVEEGSILFSAPQRWVDLGIQKDDGQGDAFEGTIA